MKERAPGEERLRRCGALSSGLPLDIRSGNTTSIK
jgi:hypothetical protein